MTTLARRFGDWGVSELLHAQPGLALAPSSNGLLIVRGELAFRAQSTSDDEVEDRYALEIRVPTEFPHQLPTVKETAGRIPPDYHTNPDGTLCLGSPARLHLALHRHPTLPGFVADCVIPYLFGFSRYQHTGVMPFGHLRHGIEGLFQDYMSLFDVRSRAACQQMLRLVGMKKRLANKLPCPCGSGRRVGKCHNRILNPLRDRLGRDWWRRQHATLAPFADSKQ